MVQAIKTNWGAFLWIILNGALVISVIGSLLSSETMLNQVEAYLIGFGVYVTSMLVALSPIGELVVRHIEGCQRIRDPITQARIRRCYSEVVFACRKAGMKIPENVKLYISNDKTPNAFAIGRSTICVTKGLLVLDDSQIKGVLAHEVGHLVRHDSEVILAVAVCNLFVTTFSIVIRLVYNVIYFIVCLFAVDKSEDGSIFLLLLSKAISFIVNAFVIGVFAIWTKLGLWLSMLSSRGAEYEADAFAGAIGFNYGLISALLALTDEGKYESKGLFAAMEASHPAPRDRINALLKRARIDYL